MGSARLDPSWNTWRADRSEQRGRTKPNFLRRQRPSADESTQGRPRQAGPTRDIFPRLPACLPFPTQFTRVRQQAERGTRGRNTDRPTQAFARFKGGTKDKLRNSALVPSQIPRLVLFAELVKTNNAASLPFFPFCPFRFVPDLNGSNEQRKRLHRMSCRCFSRTHAVREKFRQL